jgi:hypothetical protein
MWQVICPIVGSGRKRRLQADATSYAAAPIRLIATAYGTNYNAFRNRTQLPNASEIAQLGHPEPTHLNTIRDRRGVQFWFQIQCGL